MYKVIGGLKTRAFRVIWMLEELGQPYELIPAAPRSDEAKAYNPTGKVPALMDGDELLTDSVAIMQYLADKHGMLTAPAGTIARARQDAMLFWLIDEFDAILWAAAKHSFVWPKDMRVPEIKDSLKAEFGRAAATLAERLKGPFLMGITIHTSKPMRTTESAAWQQCSSISWVKLLLRPISQRLPSLPMVPRETRVIPGISSIFSGQCPE